MIERRLAAELEKVAQRFRRLRLLGALAVNWIAAIGVVLLLVAIHRRVAPLTLVSVAVVAGVFAVVAVFIVWCAVRSVRDVGWLARKIESRHPALQSRLVTAVEQKPNASGRLGYLQETVIREAIDLGRRENWEDVVSDGKLFAAQIAQFFSLLAFAVALLMMVVIIQTPPAGASSDPSQPLLTAVGRYRVEVKPGDAEIERGSSLVVVARFQGELPPEAELVVTENTSKETTRVAMSRSLDDPLFGGRVATVSNDLTYRVEFDGQHTDSFRISVFEYPALVQADARLKFPEYTSMEEKLVEDTRRVSAVEGTQLTWVCHLNKPVKSARLEHADGESLPLSSDTVQANTYSVTLTLSETARYRLHLEDEQGRVNKDPPELVVNVVPNRPPEIEVAWPSRDAQVSPLEEFDVEATAWDDFGTVRSGIIFSHAGGEPQEIVLGEGGGPKERLPMAHQIDLEQLQAEPDQLLSYHFFAEDIGPDGAPRRTFSDMYFAEVRRFEEIFRQGEQPPGGQQQQQQQQQAGQNAQQAQQLAELQKQIIAATWNLIRRERPDRLTSQFTPDVRLLVESQGAALEQLEELGAEVEDPQSQAHVQEVKQHMVSAVQDFMQAVDDQSPEPLRAALPDEQAAYQGLLKLRAREHQVMRSNSRQQSQSGSGGSSSAMQQQLDELELKNDENRYETQRAAQNQEQTQQQEVRQALNRLRELARRQEDLNKQLQELQSALEQAQTEQEQEEIRRRLKRLREEEQQMLRDMDELRERMDQPQNQQEMAEAQQRLAEARENVRQASEALEQGMVSQALAEGTRAERQFEELRDEFRRKAAGQFGEQMREMREAARELDESQQQLAEQMQQLEQPNRPRNLRDTGVKEEVAQQFEQQKDRLANLLEQMEQVVQEAEQPEPLLADQLYETLRSTRQEKVENALETARQLAEAGLVDQAQVVEEAAQSGIEKLRQGVERAAESVLGDETEALRRARETLENLTEQLERESQQRGGTPGANNQAPGERSEPSEPGAQAAGERQRESNEQPTNSENENQSSESEGQPSKNEGQQAGEGQRSENAPQSPRGRGQQSEQSPQEGESPQAGESQQESEQGRASQQSGRGPSQENAEAESPSSQSPSGSQGTQPPEGASSSPRTGRSLRGSPQQSEQPQRGSRGGRPGESQEESFGGSERQFDQQGAPMNPLTGEDFRPWSDQLRDVEEMLEDPALRAEAARIRDRARAMRAEFKRHSQEPNWDTVQLEVIEPMNDLRDRIVEELVRRQAKDTLTPIDRDPTPPQFAEPLRRYYEELGRGQ